MAYYDIAVLFYILSFLVLLINFYFNKPILQTLQTIFTAIGIFANIIQILLQIQMAQMKPVYMVQDLLMLVSLSLGLVYLLINLRYKRPYVGFFLLPMMIVAGLVSLFLQPSPVDSMAAANMWLYIHIPLTIVGTAFFLSAFAAGMMYFILERQLKAKKFGRIFDRLPPLATIDKLNSGSLFLGFAFYTAGMLAAIGWTRFKFNQIVGGTSVAEITFDESFRMKTILACMAWVVFTIIVVVKVKTGMNARQTALASIVGFVAVLLTYVSVVLFIMR